MRTVGIRELKNKLSEYLRMVRDGQVVLVTDRGEVVAEIRAPGTVAPEDIPYPGLWDLARRGLVRIGAPNDPDVYAPTPGFPGFPEGTAAALIDEERGDR
jgi:hypothetical protein